MRILPTGSDDLALNFLLINAMPGKHLVLLPNAPTFTITAVSDDYLAALGVRREQLVGYGVFEVFFGDGRNQATALQLMDSLSQVIATQQTHTLTQQPHQWPNPHTGVLEWRVWRLVNKPVMGNDGQLAFIINTVEDVTSEVQLVEVAQANRYLQAVIDLFKEPLQVLQPVYEQGKLIDFRFKFTNQAYAAYAQATPEHLQGKRVSEVFPGYVDTDSFIKAVDTYQTGEPLTFEIHYDKDGLDLYNVMSTTKLDEEVVIHFTDFTRLRQLQLQLENKIEELKHSNENLQQFAYIASHDLQEPLRKIQQFGDLLLKQYADQLGEGTHYLRRMQTAAARMSTLMRDLLSFSRLSTQLENRVFVSLTEVVESALSDLDLVISETGAQVSVEPLPTVEGDASQLGQLFQNLFSNALKFRRSGTAPVIGVSVQRIAALNLPAGVKPSRAVAVYQRIDVSDNGIGFDEKYAEHIFEVFQRLHGKNDYAGTGVGLAICQKVAASHGGGITASSQPGQGATFSVYFPVS
ncbi:sensor histidine kinase [Spirosoma fluviale]|uniref:histidine kinase n=1 Tax=Spirosoma fluviale TaxID=1597977 RepID=A0A286GU22_9BACT|nr:ATP-binding protein [Spirosoma fluviale]SOD99073.1 PAS fold-containing protein [Spirosoma fluviale]